jgi:hypothetical protein
MFRRDGTAWRQKLAAQLGRFLADLHAIPAGEAARLGVEAGDAER